MSDPITLAAAALSAVGTIQQGRAGRAQGEYAARTAELQGEAARREAARDAAERRREASARAAALRARFGGAGLRVEGTPVDVLGQIAAEGEHAALLAEHEGGLDAARSRNRADAARARGAALQRSSLLRGLSPLLGALR